MPNTNNASDTHFRYMQRMKRTSVWGQIATQLGSRAEDKVEKVFRNPTPCTLPKWIQRWVHAESNSELDRLGIDFSFSTDVGPLGIQIKSSEFLKKKFENRHRGRDDVKVIVVNICEDDIVTYNKIISCLSRWRKERLVQFQQSK